MSKVFLLLVNIQNLIENLTKLKAPLQAEIAHFAEEISAKNSKREYLSSPWSLQRIPLAILILFIGKPEITTFEKYDRD